MVDKYNSMKELLTKHPKSDYAIRFDPQHSSIAILAPHGGNIEPGTSQIAEAIAANKYNFYSFCGLPPEDACTDLHVTSSRYDAPEDIINRISTCEIVVAIHGFADHVDKDKQSRAALRKNGTRDPTIYVGGLYGQLRDAIADELKAIRWILNGPGPRETKLRIVISSKDTDRYPGRIPSNICNLTKPRGMNAQRGGAQLEISRTLRDELDQSDSSETNLSRISGAVRRAIEKVSEK